MKQLFSLFLVTAAMLVWSCTKEGNDPVEESPFFTFFDEANIQIDTTPIATSTWEYGFAFTPLKDGKITKFGIKLPSTGNFTVTLWDVSGATPAVLAQKSVDTNLTDGSGFLEIPEVQVKSGKKLAITILANSFYRITKKNGGKFSFPIERENIRIESFNESVNNTGEAAFPATTTDDHVAPCVNVIFIAD